MLSIPLFISLLPNEEFIALDPISRSIFARSPPSLLPACLRFCFIFWKPGAARLCKILLLFLLGPIFLALITLMFLGSRFLLILSYFVANDLPLGKLTIFGDALRLKVILSPIVFFVSYDLYLKFFLNLVLLFRLKLALLKRLLIR